MKKNRLILLVLIIVLFSLSGCISFFDNEKAKALFNDDSMIIENNNYASFNLQSKGLNLKFDDFNGVKGIYYIVASKDMTLNIEINSILEEGLFKYVLVTPDKDIITILEQNEEGTKKETKELFLKKGRYDLKIVGNAAVVDCSVKIFNINIRDLDIDFANSL